MKTEDDYYGSADGCGIIAIAVSALLIIGLLIPVMIRVWRWALE